MDIFCCAFAGHFSQQNKKVLRIFHHKGTDDVILL